MIANVKEINNNNSNNNKYNTNSYVKLRGLYKLCAIIILLQILFCITSPYP